LSLIKEKEELINATASQLKLNNVSELATRAAQLQSELKSAKSEIEALQAKMARLKKDEILKSAQDVHGVSVLSAKTEGLTLDAVRGLCDDIRQENQNSVIIVAAVLDGKLNFVCSCGKEALKKGANAGKIIREVAAICNGGGGGRPDNATAGGKDLSKIDAALKSTPEICSHFIDG
jgi:alanyl-tRNA synthetase